MVKSFYLNVTRNLHAAMGPQLLLESSLYSRIGRTSLIFLRDVCLQTLGLTHIALLHCNIFRECYTKGSPMEDTLRMAYQASQMVRIEHGTFKRRENILISTRSIGVAVTSMPQCDSRIYRGQTCGL